MTQRLLGRALLGQGQGGAVAGVKHYEWIAPSWAIDENGYAYANPALGSELLTNMGFDSDTVWTKGSGWSIAGGVGVASAASGAVVQSVLPSLTDDYVFACDIVTRTAGTLRTHLGAPYGSGYTTTGAKTFSSSAAPAGSAFAGFNVATSFSGTVDNASVKRVTGNPRALIAEVAPKSIGVRLPLNTLNHVMRLVYGADDPDTPNNYIRVQATDAPSANFRPSMIKVVNGTITALIGSVDLTFVPDAVLELRRSGNVFSLWYNGTQVGTNQTINDTAILNGLYHGVSALTPDWRFSEFIMNGHNVPFRF